MALIFDGTHLPPLLTELHDKYKRKTQKVIDWLFSNTSLNVYTHTCARSTVTVSQLATAAKTIKENGLQVPESMFWDLKDAVKLRREMTLYYKVHFTSGHESHEYFTEQLCEMLQLLFPIPPAAATSLHGRMKTNKMPKPHHSVKHITYRQPEVEQFPGDCVDAMEPADTKEDEEIPLEEDEEMPLEETTGTIITDDYLALDLALARWCELCNSAMTKLLQYTQDTKGGNASLAYASCLANVTMNIVDEVLNAIKLESLETYVRGPAFANRSKNPKAVANCDSQGFFNLTDLIPVYDGISSMSKQHTLKTPSGCPWVKPQQLLPATHLDENLSPNEIALRCYYHMAAGVRHVNCQAATWEMFGLKGCIRPEYHLNEEYLSQYLYNTCDCLDCKLWYKDKLALSFRFQIEIYRDWFDMPHGQAQRRNPRLKVLEYANESKKAVENLIKHPILPSSQCSNLPSTNHSAYIDCLKQLLSETRFDLYHQSPTTAGQQIVALSCYNAFHASLMCNDKAKVGMILHLYNALYQKGKIGEVPLFEKLCIILEDIVFFGNRKAPNYSSCFTLFLGGKMILKDFYSARGKKMDRKNKIPVLAHPKHLPTMTDHGRWELSGLTVFHSYSRINRTVSILENARLLKLLLKKMGKPVPDKVDKFRAAFDRATAEKRSESSYDERDGPFVLHMLKEFVEEEFAGEFPVAKINWFAVCYTCLDAIHALYKQALQIPGLSKFAVASTEFGISSHFISGILLILDERSSALNIRYGEVERKDMRLAVSALKSVGAAWDLEKHLWKSM